MKYEAEHFLATQNKLGEGAVWSVDEQALYWLDIEQNFFYRWNTRTGQPEQFDAGQMVGCLRLRAKGGLVLAAQKGFAFWDFDSNKLVPGPDPENNNAGMRFNDGGVDPHGRFWAGTMYFDNKVDEKDGSLYRLDLDGSVRTMQTQVTIPNGIVWSLDRRTMYFTDTPREVIYAYDYDDATGHIENRRTFVNTQDEEGSPDGLTIDSEGFLWSSHWGGWKVVRYDPDGKIDREIYVNAERVTSCAFGGPDLDELFITTAWTGMNDAQRRQQPQAGDLFHLKTDVKGVPTVGFAG